MRGVGLRGRWVWMCCCWLGSWCGWVGRASLVCRIEGGMKRGTERWDEERREIARRDLLLLFVRFFSILHSRPKRCRISRRRLSRRRLRRQTRGGRRARRMDSRTHGRR